MNKLEIASKWIEALESGEYKQGKGDLVKKDGDKFRYCPQGLLMKVAGYQEAQCLVDYYFAHDLVWGFAVGEVIKRGAIPDQIAKELYLDVKFPITQDYSLAMWLARVNDGGGFTFAEIAKVLRQTYLPYLEERCQISSN